MNLLEWARIEPRGDAWAKRRVHLPTEFASTERDPSGPSQDAVPRRRLRRRWVMLPGGILILGVVALVVVLLTGQLRSSGFAASPVIGAQDGSDPGVTGCSI